jgi:hypothetical protein
MNISIPDGPEQREAERVERTTSYVEIDGVDEPRRTKIKLGQRLFAPAYTLITVADDEGDVEIVEIELYRDADYLDCMSDGNPIDSFRASQQSQIYSALALYVIESREAERTIRRLEPIAVRPVELTAPEFQS